MDLKELFRVGGWCPDTNYLFMGISLFFFLSFLFLDLSLPSEALSFFIYFCSSLFVERLQGDNNLAQVILWTGGFIQWRPSYYY